MARGVGGTVRRHTKHNSPVPWTRVGVTVNGSPGPPPQHAGRTHRQGPAPCPLEGSERASHSPLRSRRLRLTPSYPSRGVQHHRAFVTGIYNPCSIPPRPTPRPTNESVRPRPAENSACSVLIA